MTRFAVKYPARVRHIVYLDAAYDMGAALDAAVHAKLLPPGGNPPAHPLREIEAGSRLTRLEFHAIQCPALAFFVINKPEAVGKWYEPFELGYKREQIEIFGREMRRGQVVQFRDTDHLFFNDPGKIDGVVETIRGFLAKL